MNLLDNGLQVFCLARSRSQKPPGFGDGEAEVKVRIASTERLPVRGFERGSFFVGGRVRVLFSVPNRGLARRPG